MPSMTEAIRLVISGDSKGGVKALGEVADAAGKTQGVFGKYGAGLNKASNYAAVGVAALTGVIVKSVVDYEAYGKSIRDVTRLTDISVESASTLVGEWKRFGVDATAGANGVKFFNKNLDMARQGSAKQIEAFQRLGLSIDDLKTMDDDALLMKTRDALATMGPSAERTAISLALMGKGGTAMMPWLNVAPKQMAEVNKQLKDAGLIWDDKQLKQYADAAAAQREMQIALTGIEQTIARDVVPAMTPFVRLFGSALRFIRPIMPALVPLTGALAVFVGVVKGANLVQGAWNGLLKLLPARLVKAKVAEEGATVATRAGTGAMKAQMITLGMYGIALAAAAVAIYGIVKAYQSWQQAAQQAAAAAAGAQATLDANASKLDPAFVAQQQAAINADKYKSPQGVGGWLSAAFQGMWNYNPLTSGLKKFGAGGDFIARGAQQIVVGDNPAGERVTVTPLNRKGAGGGDTHFHFHVGQIIGTDERAARQLWNTVKPIAMSDMRMKMAMSRG